MRVCIVGASGKLGQYMVQQSLDRGDEVVGVCRQESVGKLDAFKGRITVIPGATDDRAVIERAVSGCDAVLTVLVARGVHGYSTGTTQAVLDYAPPGARLVFSSGWHITRDGQDVYSWKLKALVNVLGPLAKRARFADLADQVEACRRIFASDTRWTVVRGSDLEEGESEGLPVWSRHVGDPVPASNRTRRRDRAERCAALTRRSGQDLDGACEPGAERLLKRHVQVAECFELGGARERAGVDGAQAAVLDEPADRVLGVLVVAGEEHVQRLAGDLALDQSAGERGVERLDDPGARGLSGDLRGGGAGLDGQRLEGLRVDGVGDVDDDPAAELVPIAAEHLIERLVPHGEHDDVVGELVADGAGAHVAGELAGERVGLAGLVTEQRHGVAAGERARGDATAHVAGADDGDVHGPSSRGSVVRSVVRRRGPGGLREPPPAARRGRASRPSPSRRGPRR